MDTTSQNVVLLCPCCASPVDAVTGREPVELDCVSCGQQWSMTVDAVRIHAHSLA